MHDETYEELIHKIGKFQTCEEFWAIYSHLVRPDKLQHTVSLHMFRGDSRAMWEDAENRDGGSFLMRFQKGQIKYVWEKLLLHLIGEQFPTDVFGAVVSPRPKFDLIYLWHRKASNEQLRLDICSCLMDFLDLPVKTRIDYSPFDEIMTNHEKNSFQYVIETEGPVLKILRK
jgi:translation initiation factor 4E